MIHNTIFTLNVNTTILIKGVQKTEIRLALGFKNRTN